MEYFQTATSRLAFGAENHGKDAQLVLLQEAQTTPELVSYATANYLAADQVPAFVLPQHPSGVMTLAAAHPVYCCPLREREPLLRLSKSALITVYPLYNGELLMVVNIHAVNFSLESMYTVSSWGRLASRSPATGGR